MTHQTLTRPRPGRGYPGAGPAAIRDAVPLNQVITPRARRPAGRGASAVVVPRPQAPRASFRQRVAAWRARNWRRAVLAWSILSLALVVAAAESATAFPGAQAGPAPAVLMAVRVVGGLTAAGVPVVLIALP